MSKSFSSNIELMALASSVRQPVSAAFITACILALAACANTYSAPVEDRSVRKPPDSRTTTTNERANGLSRWHVVQPGETLYGIAKANNVDLNVLSSLNNINDKALIEPGRRLRLPSIDSKVAQTMPLDGSRSGINAQVLAPGRSSASQAGEKSGLKKAPLGGKVRYSEAELLKLRQLAVAGKMPKEFVSPALATSATPGSTGKTLLEWPVHGSLINNFGENGSKGLDIAGKRLTPVRAAADGKVVFVGLVKKYGQLVVVKHNNKLITAYGHNEKILVREGVVVKKGQEIAKMGSSGTSTVRLHFEARLQGKPIDPLPFLPELPGRTTEAVSRQ